MISTLYRKNILLVITGGIAAYKSAELIRLLKDKKANVQVVLTQSAKEFVSPLTLQALSENGLRESLFDLRQEQAMGHIELARWADLIVIAPASANFIAKLSCGLADDLPSTLCLVASVPMLLCPAMNCEMWEKQAVQENITTLKRRKIEILGPYRGELACGDYGFGRLAELADIVSAVEKKFIKNTFWAKLPILITAGPTRENIDPVRFLSNRSSGKMGYALANAATALGANVTLVSGPTALSPPNVFQLIAVQSAQQMYQAVMDNIEKQKLFIGCAAVADYRVDKIPTQKIKKSDESMTLTLIKNPDILRDVAIHPKRPITIGFAAETQALIKNAKQKLVAKKLDAIIANDVSNNDLGFDVDANQVTYISKKQELSIEKMEKQVLAETLLALIGKEFFG